MKFDMTSPCSECPFLKSMKRGFTVQRLREFASGAFPCHKTAQMDDEEGQYEATPNSQHCAGALIFLEKRGQSSNFMRVMERLGFYDYEKLDMTVKAKVR